MSWKGGRGKSWIKAKKTEVDGVVFDSKMEAARYIELGLLLMAGEIYGLSHHNKYPLIIKGKEIGHYTDDFAYYEKGNGVLQIEDVKGGFVTPQARLRMKVFEACYPDFSFWIYTKGRRKRLNERNPRKPKSSSINKPTRRGRAKKGT